MFFRENSTMKRLRASTLFALFGSAVGTSILPAPAAFAQYNNGYYRGYTNQMVIDRINARRMRARLAAHKKSAKHNKSHAAKTKPKAHVPAKHKK